MEYRHLLIDTERVYLLGYELSLTPNERRILECVANNTHVGGVTSAELLSLITGLRRIGEGAVAVHISAINKKAMAIGERRLIVSQKRKYILNEFM